MKYKMRRFIIGFTLGVIISLAFISCACTINPVQMIDALVPIIAGLIPIFGGIAAALLPTEGVIITAAVTLVVDGLNELKTLADNYHTNPNDDTLAKVQAGFTDVQSNLAAILKLGQIKDPITQLKVTGVINGASATLAAIESTILAKHPATVAASQIKLTGVINGTSAALASIESTIPAKHPATVADSQVS